jgi:dTDP-4-amino-4,6-dideoxygalactose transaminase
MRNFGFVDLDKVINLGINGKMSEISAAMGLTSLEKLEDFISTNFYNYQIYHQGLENIPGVKLVKFDINEKNNYQYIVIEVNESISGLDRDTLMKLLHAENVLARRYFFPGVHHMEPYQSYFPNAGLLLPETEKITHKVLQLPTGTTITEDEIKDICKLIRFSVQNSSLILKKLGLQG